VLESIIYPSKVISDQYRSTQIVTLDGQTYNGLAAPMGDTVTVLLQDGSKVTLKKGDIERQFASLVSVMPERLLDELTLEEIADLFALLELPAKKE
jgi:putative heme-binding domain-containing protein